MASAGEGTVIKVGDKLPDHTFSWIAEAAEGEETKPPQELKSEKLFYSKGKIVLFGLPGAFTPTCSAKHLPGFIEDEAALRAKGVEAIYCLSVNDSYVMKAWSDANKAAGKVLLLADGDGAFVRKLGLHKETGAFGGIRSQRFALIAEAGVITHLAIEEPGKFEVSSSEAVAAFC